MTEVNCGTPRFKKPICSIDRQQIREEMALVEKRVASLETTVSLMLALLRDLANAAQRDQVDLIETKELWDAVNAGELPF